MTKQVLLIFLIGATATSVLAADWKDSRRDALDFCRQFVIRDPDPEIRLGHFRDCVLQDQGDPWSDPHGH
jgi:hypothetical protein